MNRFCTCVTPFVLTGYEIRVPSTNRSLTIRLDCPKPLHEIKVHTCLLLECGHILIFLLLRLLTQLPEVGIQCHKPSCDTISHIINAHVSSLRTTINCIEPPFFVFRFPHTLKLQRS